MDEKSRLGSLDHAKVVRPGEVFVYRTPGQGGTGMCVAVQEWVDLSSFPHRPLRRILVLFSNPEVLRWIVLPK